MARAVKCDSCGRLVEVGEAVTISLSAITAAQTVQSWAGVEICGACLALPAAVLLVRACEGFGPLVPPKPFPLFDQVPHPPT